MNPITKSTTYRTILEQSESEFKDRGSKFIAFAFPVQHPDDVKACIKQLKEIHPKAVHHCYAYRIGTDGNSFRAADDGEPSGSAGKPILGQIDSAGLTNVLVVVVRYFGGTLLGVPGLINAYKTAARDALANATTVEKQIEKALKFEFDYTLMNEVMRVIKQYEVKIVRQELTLFCVMEIVVALDNWESVKGRLSELRGLLILD